MEFSYSQTENFEMEKLSSDTGYSKKPVEINKGIVSFLNYRLQLRNDTMTSSKIDIFCNYVLFSEERRLRKC